MIKFTFQANKEFVKSGDFLTFNKDGAKYFTKGNKYKVSEVSVLGFYTIDDNGNDHFWNWDKAAKKFILE